MDIEDDYIEYTTEEIQSIKEYLKSNIQYIRNYPLEKVTDVILKYISEEIELTPERRNDIILETRTASIVELRKIMDILGLKINMNNEQVIEKIEDWLIDNGKSGRLILNSDFPMIEKFTQFHGILIALGKYFTQAAIINLSNKLLITNGIEGLSSETSDNNKKIKEILEKVRGAFNDPGHLDIIIEALIEYSDNGNLPKKTNRKNIQVGNKDFYPHFKQLKNETHLTVPGIALILTFFICQNNGSGNSISQSTIETNIKKNYPKL